ncbi:hypothetical protein C6558_37720 [Ensifer sp. NM-2]|nr:hypothetical protein C6558_37720 [Ensifer sp. NM-2]
MRRRKTPVSCSLFGILHSFGDQLGRRVEFVFRVGAKFQAVVTNCRYFPGEPVYMARFKACVSKHIEVAKNETALARPHIGNMKYPLWSETGTG